MQGDRSARFRRRPAVSHRWSTAGRRWLVVSAVQAVVAVGALLAAAGPASAADAVPVLGRTVVDASGGQTAAVVTLIHGVRRIPGGTVLYYSVGAPQSDSRSYGAWTGWYEQSLIERYTKSDTLPAASVHLIDTDGKQVYSTLVDKDGLGIASDVGTSWPLNSPKGQLLVQYAVFPTLPTSVTAVDVQIGQSDVVQAVPVSAGPMTPAVAAGKPIPLGTGWPTVDTAAVAAADNPSGSIYPWVTSVSDLDNSLTQRARSRQLSVDLSADVLFAVDQATLTSAAKKAIAKAAATVNAQASVGSSVSVTGYTDNTGTESHNLDLSRRRAAAVQAALKTQITVSGVTLAVSGRGEADPVADNGTDAGRQANRRVSVAFTPKGD